MTLLAGLLLANRDPGCQTYNLERVGNNANSHELLSVVATLHHERVGQALNDWALCLPESLRSISAGGVRDVDRRSDLNVIPVVELVSLSDLDIPSTILFHEFPALPRSRPPFSSRP